MKQIVDISNKIDKLPNNMLLTKQRLYELQVKENAALTICAGVLGNCYLMLEIIDWYITESISKIRKQPWFKMSIKNDINKSKDFILKEIKASRRSSQSSCEYMTEMADSMYELLRQDLLIFKNSIMLQLKNVKYDTSPIADIIVIDTLLSWNCRYYDNTMKQMKEFYNNPDYNSWFYQAKCERGYKLWRRAVETFANLYLDNEIDLNNSQLITNALTIIDNKMNSDDIANQLRIEHCNINNDGVDVLSEAFAVFGREGVTPVEELKEQSNNTSQEETQTTEDNIAEILSTKYNVQKLK